MKVPLLLSSAYLTDSSLEVATKYCITARHVCQAGLPCTTCPHSLHPAVCLHGKRSTYPGHNRACKVCDQDLYAYEEDMHDCATAHTTTERSPTVIKHDTWETWHLAWRWRVPGISLNALQKASKASKASPVPLYTEMYLLERSKSRLVAQGHCVATWFRARCPSPTRGQRRTDATTMAASVSKTLE